jgi:hypothetical protein
MTLEHDHVGLKPDFHMTNPYCNFPLTATFPLTQQCDVPHLIPILQGDEQVIANSRNHAQRWNEVMEKSDHSVTLIDLCGEKLESSAMKNDICLPSQCYLFGKIGDRRFLKICDITHYTSCRLQLPSRSRKIPENDFIWSHWPYA